MGLKTKVLALLPSNKWCGCDRGIDEEHSYQFRVRAESEDGDSNLLQVREKITCTECGDEDIDVLIEESCEYEPKRSVHERRVGVDDGEMQDYGFMDENELSRMLIEMRLGDSLDPQ